MSECEKMSVNLALYAGGDLDGEEKATVENHLEVCRACRKELEKIKATVKLSGALEADAPEFVEFMDGVKLRRTKYSARFRRVLVASAAALLVAVVLLVIFIREDGRSIIDDREEVAVRTPVEVERVGYSEATVRVVEVEDKPMTIVWIVSEEVASCNNN